MTVETRILVAEALPPLTVAVPAASRARQTDPMPRLGRMACVLAALALPALGIAVADTVHRTATTKAPQAAAPVIPSDGAAAPRRAEVPARAFKTAMRATADGKRRS
jgi:hypothetical protein